MERAQTGEVAAGAAQADVRADNLNDIGARANFFGSVFADLSHHASSADASDRDSWS